MAMFFASKAPVARGRCGSGLQQMNLNSKIAWGLAWAGLAVVVAVPSIDFLTSRTASETAAAATIAEAAPPAAAPVRPTAAATPPAPVATTTGVTTTKTANGVIITPAGSTPPADPVDTFLKSGKALPDYISGGVPATPDTQVAAIDPAPVVTAPTPFPAWARPKPVAAKAAPVASPEPVVIIDESTVTGALGPSAGPVPPAPIVDDADNWDTESLRQYLERRGILDGASADTRSSATVTERPSNYDPDGFYLSDGPNNDRLERRRRVERLFEQGGEDHGFTLF